MRMLFGTDGIRGIAGDPPLDRATVFAVGAALGHHVKRQHEPTFALAKTRPGVSAKPRVVIGQDTRESSAWIAQSLTSGLEWAGAAVQSAGVTTTPAVAFLARGGFDAGVVISASHNPWTDNGIKIFGQDGYKLSDEAEENLEGDIIALLHGNAMPADAVPTNGWTTAVGTDAALLKRYVDWLAGNVAGGPLRHLRVLVDCANGAANPVAREVFRACGIQAELMCDQPDGRNINANCGALHPKNVASRVAQRSGLFDLGITFDGDADRALFSDREGRVVNGDATLLLMARDMKLRGRLKADTVVATTMSNMGLEVALARSGIRMLRAPVGDKYVLEEMQKTGATLGGEQSGHIIFRDGDSTTGDGLLTALRVMEVMARSGKSLHELVWDLKVFPQTIKNVRVKEKKPLEQFPAVAAAIQAAQQELDGTGRVVVRYSGTEALARVMVEAESEAAMRRITDEIAGAIQKEIGV